MQSVRDLCPKRDRCGTTGHYLDVTSGKYTRCECMEAEINKRSLGVFFTPNVKQNPALLKKANDGISILLEGPFNSIRPYMAGVFLYLKNQRKTTGVLDAYRLIEIYLEKDDELQNSSHFVEVDFLALLLGFGEVKNQRLPDLIMQVLVRRELIQKPTWVILGLPLPQVPIKYGSDLGEKLDSFQRVNFR